MISVFAAYHSASLLFLNVFLLLILFNRKDHFPTLLVAIIAAILSFIYFTFTLPLPIEDAVANIDLTWSDQAKIDGGTIKGFATISSKQTVYATYRFKSEDEKKYFEKLHLPEISFAVHGHFNPIMKPSHEYAFSMEKYLKMYGAMGVFEVDTIQSLQEKKSFHSAILRQRKMVKNHIRQNFPSSLVTEAEALLIGDRSGMSEETAKDYRKLGITHLFAISGLHVGLLVFIGREILLRIRVRRESVDLFFIIFLPVYAILAGSAPSVWRAVIVTIGIILIMYTKTAIRLDSVLAISALGFIFYKPFVVFQPGFQLSYLAALSLIMSAGLLVQIRSKMKLSFSVTLITQIALYPVLLFHFFELSLSSFFVNLVYVPVYSVIILPMNLLLLLLTMISMPLAKIIFHIYEPLRSLLDVVTIKLATFPYQLWVPGKPTLIGMIVSLIGVFLFFILYERKGRVFYGMPFVLIPALFIHFSPFLDSELRVTFLDVGQGDSIVIELPYKRKVYVLDTGGTVSFGEENWKTPKKPFEVGRQIVVPYLKGRGISTVDKLIISHAHLDHMGGAHELAEEVKIREIHISPNSDTAFEMEKLISVAFDKGIPIIEKQDGDSWTQNEFEFYYLGPQNTTYAGNDSSLILFMTTKGPSFLFTGDAETLGERVFLEKYQQINFGEVILKAGHHGSKTSSTEPFVKSIQPVVAIISAGRNNRYKHPNKEVLETFQKYNIPVLVTAERHSITVHVKNKDWIISTIQ